MIVVSNTGPIIALAKINQLALLSHYFQKICLSPAVYYELTEKGKGKTAARDLSKYSWIKTVEVQDLMAVKILELELDQGEAETIILSKELNADLTLLDESIARKIANALNLKVKGTIGLLVQARRDGVVKNLKQLLDELKAKNVWISNDVYIEALKLAGEMEIE